jgi:hypothetical protein
MATTINFKDYFDLPVWRPEAPPLASVTAGMCLAWDNRNTLAGSPYLYFLRSTTALDVYDPMNGDWMALASPGLAGSVAAGSAIVLHPSQGPSGTISGTGANTTSFALTTALPAAVGINQLANRGDSLGFLVRVVSTSAGKTEIRRVVACTSGTTPRLWLDSPLTFTPTGTDTYEFRSGRVYMLAAGTTAAGFWKHYDILTNSYSGNLSTTNLPSTIGTDSIAMVLAEAYVPYNRSPGEGFISGGATNSDNLNCIQATAATSTSITASGIPTDIQADEYRNFQVRIVEDTVTPTSVGQRRRISTHTSGSTAVFTVASWAVTPSSSAKFVVENDNDKILLRTSASTSIFTYNITANTWDTTTFAAGGSAPGAGMMFQQGFGYTRDVGVNARHSHVFAFRGSGTNTLDIFDIAGAATGAWTTGVVYGKQAQTFTTGTCGAYDPATREGRFMHININGTQRFAKFDLKNRVLDAGSYFRFSQSTAIVGQKLACGLFVDGNTKANFVYALNNTQQYMHSLVIQ